MEIQLPVLKKQNLKHDGYAKRSIRELFPADQLDNAETRTFDYPTSIIAFNDGNGHFSIRPLPVMTQLSSINAIQTMDLNGDGNTDLVMGGNEFGFLPQFGRLDGSCGHILLGDGKGGFTWTAPDRSGVRLPGQIRDIRVIPGKDKEHVNLLFLQNDEYPVLYQLNSKK
jgi:hypothetical protein